jgi:hypothetical protein
VDHIVHKTTPRQASEPLHPVPCPRSSYAPSGRSLANRYQTHQLHVYAAWLTDDRNICTGGAQIRVTPLTCIPDPGGAYLTVNQQVGGLIDFYNIQFYNQASDAAGVVRLR